MIKLTFLGHSAFKVEIGSYILLIDPFITGNPQATVSPEDLHPQYILVTHGHGDHFGDTIDIAKRNNSLIIAINELAIYCSQKGVKAHPMHIGGAHTFDFGTVRLTQAHHSSTIIEGKTFIPAGDSAGIIIDAEGKRLYHAGDTCVFGDMKLIGEMYPLDVALLPIGSNFTMDIYEAVQAVKFLNPRVVIPIHYNTFNLIKADPEEFARMVPSQTETVILKPGDTYNL